MSIVYQTPDLSSGPGTAIRLLTLLPGIRDSIICCSLAVATLDDDLHYEALSYTWGDSTIKREININHNHCLQVTANLETALQYLRYPDNDRVLWIDAICINQDDNVEKSKQVPLMGEIYGRAFNVLVWLGELDPAARMGFDLLEQ
jgi:hypothetical protein